MQRFPFTFVRIDNPGDYEKERIVFRAKEDIDSLHPFLLIYKIETIDSRHPDYERIRILTFDDIRLAKGSFLQIFTCSGTSSMKSYLTNTSLIKTIYWNLSAPIWHIPLSSYELILKDDSINGGFLKN